MSGLVKCAQGLLLLLVTVSICVAGPDPRRLIVTLQFSDQHKGPLAEDLPAQVRGLADAAQLEGLQFLRNLNAGRLVLRLPESVTESDVTQAMAHLQSLPQVATVEKDVWVTPAFVPNDSRYAGQWYLFESVGIRAPDAWDLERGVNTIVIGHLDTGMVDHVDVDAGRILPGDDFVSDADTANDGDGRDADPTDPGDAVVANECGNGEPATDSSWHGLHTGGIMMATADNATGVAGLNHVSRLLPLRVLGKCGGPISDVLAAMQWAVGATVDTIPVNSNPARVLNLSFGAEGACSPSIQAVVDQVIDAGAVLVAAAGNGQGGDVANFLPANCDGVVSVAALGSNGELPAYTNVGSSMTIAAPGGSERGILSVYNTGSTVAANDAYAELVGTSQSSAMVAAVVSLMLSANGELANDDVINLLRSSAQAFPDASCNTSLCGAGVVDAAAAVAAALDFQADPEPEPDPESDPAPSGGGGGCVLASAASSIDGSMALLLLVAALGALRSRPCSRR